MGQPVVHFEIIGSEPGQGRSGKARSSKASDSADRVTPPAPALSSTCAMLDAFGIANTLA